MSSVKVDGFKSSPVFEQIDDGLKNMSADEKKAIIKKVNGVFVMNIKNSEGKQQEWTIDLKKGEVYKGPAKGKADITINVSDDTYCDLATGKLNGQKAYMAGKLKVKGNIMLATKLDTVLKTVGTAKL